MMFPLIWRIGKTYRGTSALPLGHIPWRSSKIAMAAFIPAAGGLPLLGYAPGAVVETH
jgi:hypothetical protein